MQFTYLFLVFLTIVFILFCVHVVVYVEVRGQPTGVSSLLALCRFWRLSSGLQTQVIGVAFTH